MAGLRVDDLMTPEPVAVAPEADLREASDLMDSRQVRHLPVVDADGHVTGLLSHRDLIRRATASIEDQLLTVPDDTLVFPGHNDGTSPQSTIGNEKQSNPFVR